MAKYKVRWKVPEMRGDEWLYGAAVHDDLESACHDAEDVFGYEGLDIVQVFRDEGDVGVIERVWQRDRG